MFSQINTTAFLIAGGLLLAGWGGTWLWQKSTISTLQGQVTRLETDNGTLRGNNRTLRGALAEQTASIDALGLISEYKLARSEEALRAALAANQDLETQVAAILAAPIPDSPVEACLAGDALILETYR